MLTLVTIVLLCTAMWPLNRWAMRRGARPESIGIVISVVALALGVPFALKVDDLAGARPALLFGGIAGVAYSIGFVLIIFHCLKIGPAGPTVLVNNLGMVWPIAISMFAFSQNRTPPPAHWAGLGSVAVALALMGVNRGEPGSSGSITRRWVWWVLAGWVFSGVSQGSQFLSSQYAPRATFTYVVALYAVSLLILLAVSAFRRGGRPRRVEIIAGAGTGVILAMALPMTLWLLAGRTPAMVVYPVTVAGPIVLMLLIGHAVLKERLNAVGWAASAAGVAGILLLSLS